MEVHKKIIPKTKFKKTQYMYLNVYIWTFIIFKEIKNSKSFNTFWSISASVDSFQSDVMFNPLKTNENSSEKSFTES